MALHDAAEMSHHKCPDLRTAVTGLIKSVCFLNFPSNQEPDMIINPKQMRSKDPGMKFELHHVFILPDVNSAKATELSLHVVQF